MEDYTLFFGDDTPVVISYCNISGNSTHEWIQRVSIGGMSHESGNDGGYADHTAKVVTAIRGTVLELELIPGHSANVFGEAWKIWVDWNRDGTFEEPTELVFVQAPAFGRVRGSIAIPTDVPLGRTRLRIAMLWNKLPNACGNNPWGEAEDYTIEVSGGANLQPFGATWGLSAAGATATNGGHIYRVYPNPASSSLTIAWLSALQENSITLTVLDAQGRHLREYKGVDVAQGQLELDVSNLPSGMYQIRLNAGQRTDVQRFVITR